MLSELKFSAWRTGISGFIPALACILLCPLPQSAGAQTSGQPAATAPREGTPVSAMAKPASPPMQMPMPDPMPMPLPMIAQPPTHDPALEAAENNMFANPTPMPMVAQPATHAHAPQPAQNAMPQMQMPMPTTAAATMPTHATAGAHTAMPPVASPGKGGDRKILYFRNPMGLADVSKSPKKDSMGMDYIPVYEGEAPTDAASVTLTPGRIQRSGVRTEIAEARVIVTPVHGYGTVKFNEGAIFSISAGVEGTIDELFVNHVGQTVRAGQPLFRMWSNNPQLLQIEIARHYKGNGDQDTSIQTSLLRNPRNVVNRSDWPSPTTGVVIEKRVVNGQRVSSTDEILRIADPSKMWVYVDIAERDLSLIKLGQKAVVVPMSSTKTPLEGTVIFVLPEIKKETRTARVCLEVPNPDDLLKAESYADVTIRVGADKDPVVAVSEDAVIDDGVRSHVLLDKGSGRFAVRDVVVGARGDGFVEILSGVSEGETVVTSANFLIDSEANISAALAAFTAAAKK